MLKPTYLSNEYMVSDAGFVISKRGKPLKPSINHKGYQIVNLMINGKRKGVAVHTLVARAFCSGYKPHYTVNHKDGVKTNNKATNLEWITYKKQMEHARNVLGVRIDSIYNGKARGVIAYDIDSKAEVFREGCIMDAARTLKPNATYKQLRATKDCILRVLKGTRYSYLGYIWKYIE